MLHMWLGMEEGFLFSRTHFFSSSRNHLVKVITFYSYLSLFFHICILLKYVHICEDELFHKYHFCKHFSFDYFNLLLYFFMIHAISWIFRDRIRASDIKNRFNEARFFLFSHWFLRRLFCLSLAKT